MFRLHRLRFSLRALLIALTVFAIWLAWHVDGVRKQRAAVKGIQDNGGWVYYDFQGFAPKFGAEDLQAESWVPGPIIDVLGIDFFHRVVHVNLVCNGDEPGPQVLNRSDSDAALPYVTGLPKLRGLFLHQGQATDHTMRYVAQLKDLESLMIWSGELTDHGVARLHGLPNLRYIHMSNAGLTDESFRTFNTLPRLESLSLQGNSFTDAAFAHLDYKPTLTTMWVGLGWGGGITDGAIEHIARQEQLEELGLQQTKVTAEGLMGLTSLRRLKALHVGPPYRGKKSDLSRLIDAMPNCKVD